MGRLQVEISGIEKEIELARRDLDVLFEEFGQMAAALRLTVNIPVCSEENHDYAHARNDLEATEIRLAHVRSALAEIDNRSSRITSLKSALASMEQEHAICCLKAGAIAFEAACAGTLPEHLQQMLPSIDDQQRIYAMWQVRRNKAEQRLFASHGIPHALARMQVRYCSRRLGSVSRSYEQLFRKIGQQMDSNGCVMDLPGLNAPPLARALSKIDSDMVGLREEIELQHKQIEQVQGSLAEAMQDTSAKAQASRRIEELEKQQAEQALVVRACAIEYGKALAREGYRWLDIPAVTDQIKECHVQITRHERRIQMMQRKISTLKIGIEVEELELLISQDAERIGHLKEQIGMYQRQILEVQEEIMRHRKDIDELHAKERAIAVPDAVRLEDAR